MEHRDDAPLADEPRPTAIPNDQPVGGVAGPEDEHAPARPLQSAQDGADDGDEAPQRPSG
jgi:hypothetical protein